MSTAAFGTAGIRSVPARVQDGRTRSGRPAVRRRGLPISICRASALVIGVEDARIVHVMERQRQRSGPARHLERHGCQTPRARRVGRRNVHARARPRPCATILKSGCAFVVRRAQRRLDIGDPPGDRGAQDECVPAAAPPPLPRISVR